MMAGCSLSVVDVGGGVERCELLEAGCAVKRGRWREGH